MRALPLERTPQPGVLRARGIALIRSREATVVAFIVVLGMFLEAVTGRFLAPTNLANVLLNSAGTAIVALGMTLVILTGGIDVSVGSMLGVGAVAVGYASAAGWGLGPLVLVGLTVGGLLGLVNGALIGFGGVMPVIATLGMLNILRALTFQLLRAKWISDLPPTLRNLGLGLALGVPISAWVALAITLVFVYLTTRRPLGRHIYAIGGNTEAARLAGIDLTRALLFVYTATGMLVGITALMYVGQTGIVQSNTGSGFELQVIAAVVLGGTSIMGGRGTVVGSVLGALLVAEIKNGLILLNISGLAEGMVSGVLILLAVGADLLRLRGKRP
jgi:ribose/xylose/arabinose/galactoside ABC-type transport system permease subunit